MLSANEPLMLELDKRGYAAVFVLDPFGSPFRQGEIADRTDGNIRLAFGGRGQFVVVVTTSASPMELSTGSSQLPGQEQLRAYFDVR